jgi:hypothetical protein
MPDGDVTINSNQILVGLLVVIVIIIAAYLFLRSDQRCGCGCGCRGRGGCRGGGSSLFHIDHLRNRGPGGTVWHEGTPTPGAGSCAWLPGVGPAPVGDAGCIQSIPDVTDDSACYNQGGIPIDPSMGAQPTGTCQVKPRGQKLWDQITCVTGSGCNQIASDLHADPNAPNYGQQFIPDAPGTSSCACPASA